MKRARAVEVSTDRSWLLADTSETTCKLSRTYGSKVRPSSFLVEQDTPDTVEARPVTWQARQTPLIRKTFKKSGIGSTAPRIGTTTRCPIQPSSRTITNKPSSTENSPVFEAQLRTEAAAPPKNSLLYALRQREVCGRLVASSSGSSVRGRFICCSFAAWTVSLSKAVEQCPLLSSAILLGFSTEGDTLLAYQFDSATLAFTLLIFKLCRDSDGLRFELFARAPLFEGAAQEWCKAAGLASPALLDGTRVRVVIWESPCDGSMLITGSTPCPPISNAGGRYAHPYCVTFVPDVRTMHASSRYECEEGTGSVLHIATSHTMYNVAAPYPRSTVLGFQFIGCLDAAGKKLFRVALNAGDSVLVWNFVTTAHADLTDTAVNGSHTSQSSTENADSARSVARRIHQHLTTSTPPPTMQMIWRASAARIWGGDVDEVASAPAPAVCIVDAFQLDAEAFIQRAILRTAKVMNYDMRLVALINDAAAPATCSHAFDDYAMVLCAFDVVLGAISDSPTTEDAQAHTSNEWMKQPCTRYCLQAAWDMNTGGIRILQCRRVAPADQPGFDRGKGPNFLSKLTSALVEEWRKQLIGTSPRLAREIRNDAVLRGVPLNKLVHPVYPLALVADDEAIVTE